MGNPESPRPSAAGAAELAPADPAVTALQAALVA